MCVFVNLIDYSNIYLHMSHPWHQAVLSINIPGIKTLYIYIYTFYLVYFPLDFFSSTFTSLIFFVIRKLFLSESIMDSSLTQLGIKQILHFDPRCKSIMAKLVTYTNKQNNYIDHIMSYNIVRD